jgi:hypothetical protein
MARSFELGVVLVLPACGSIDPDGLSRWYFRQSSGTDVGRKVLRRTTTEQADVRGIRPYRPGDSIRAIHWRSSARRGELMVREYDKAPVPDLVLVVEPWLPENPSEGQRKSLEAALSLTATIAINWAKLFGTKLTFALAGDPDTVRTVEPTDLNIREALLPLASVTGNDAFVPLNREVFGRSFSRAARLVVSSRANSPHAALLTRSTGQLFILVSPENQIPWYHPPSDRVK